MQLKFGTPMSMLEFLVKTTKNMPRRVVEVLLGPQVLDAALLDIKWSCSLDFSHTSSLITQVHFVDLSSLHHFIIHHSNHHSLELRERGRSHWQWRFPPWLHHLLDLLFQPPLLTESAPSACFLSWDAPTYHYQHQPPFHSSLSSPLPMKPKQFLRTRLSLHSPK